jgi:hypothetical protein
VPITFDYGASTASAIGYANYVAGASTSTTLVFRYTVQSGDYDSNGVGIATALDLNGGTVQDQSGNGLGSIALTPPASNGNSILVDTLGPSYSSAGNFLLDTYSITTGAAYSLRRLDKDYTGAAIRVRRSTDNASADIGFSLNGHLNRSALSAFVTSNGVHTLASGFVTRVYDQSGNNNHVETSTASEQPRVVINGNLNLVNTMIGFNCDGGDSLAAVNGFDFLRNTSYSVFAVEARADGRGNNYFLGNANFVGGANSALHFGYRANDTFTLAQYANDLDVNVPVYGASPAVTLLTGHLNTAVGHFLYRNSILLASNTNMSSLNNDAVGGVIFGGIGGDGSRYYFGDLFEILLFPSNQTGNRAAIESEIKSYYGIS